jgi:CHAT domain-containing protein
VNKRNYQSATLFGGIDYDTPLIEMAAEAQKYVHENRTEQYAMYRGEDERGSWGKLKYSLEETNNIANYLSDNNIVVNKYTQSDASEEAFKSLSGSSPDIIHISTHGFYYQPYVHSYLSDYSNLYFSNENNDVLNFNGLLFSGANNAWKFNKFQENVEDGILTAKEIYSLNLSNTDLLILSACQTGLGENNDIDGNEGLLRAFKVAGVNEVIITLWNISDDATSSIMKAFYKNLLEIKDPREALKTTINKAKKDMPDPYYWAPFIVIE